MELGSRFLLCLTDIISVRWVRHEKNKFRKMVKAAVFLIVGVILVIMFFVLSYN